MQTSCDLSRLQRADCVQDSLAKLRIQSRTFSADILRE
jgi:hypothetical protein